MCRSDDVRTHTVGETMKRILLLALFAFALSPLAARAQQMCFQDVWVKRVNIGEVNGNMGRDGGHAVYFMLSNNTNRWWPLSIYFNLNDGGRGEARYKMLMTAMAGGFRVRGYDHAGAMCDDIDQLEVYR